MKAPSNSCAIKTLIHQIFNDALTLGVDTISFELGSPRCGDQKLGLLLERGREVLREACLDPKWFSEIEQFMADRVAPWLGNALEGQPEVVLVPLGQQTALCRVERRPKLGGQFVLVIDQIRFETHQSCLQRAGFFSTEKSTDFISKLLLSDSGIVLLSIPRTDSLAMTRRLIATLSPGATIIDWTNQSESGPQPLPAVGPDTTWIVVLGTDPIDALWRVREAISTSHLQSLMASVSIGLAREVCPECARDGLIDPQLISQLPPGVWPPLLKNQKVGRRCKACHQTGVKGPLILVSALAIDAELKKSFTSGCSQDDVVRHGLSRGFEPLLVAGIRRVQQGETTIEAVCREVNTIAPLYERVRPSVSSGEPLALDLGAIESVTDNEMAVIPAFASSGNGAKRHLLVVEDDADQRDILSLVFKQAGYDVTMANNGRDALNKLKQCKPDCIVTDLMMPELDGAALVREIRASSAIKAVPILVLTVVSDAGKEYELLNLGVDDYCEKSVAKRVLLKRVERLMNPR